MTARSRLAAAVLSLVFGLAVGCGRRPVPVHALHAAALRGSNILLVTIDTLRADRVGAHGSQRGLTPTLDRLAAEGLRFSTVYSHAPLTLPSHATLMTARYPTRNGVRDNGTFRLPTSTPTLAAVLQGAGYRTGAFVSAAVLDARYGLGAGFDGDDRLHGDGRDPGVVQRSAEQTLAAASAWIAGRRMHTGQAPWFAWIHLYDPHEPYAPPEPFRTRYAADPYDGEIAYADASLGSFLAPLRGDGTLDHTLLVVASDHGESLGEHGERTHGLFAYDATLRVPLILSAPGHIAAAVFDQTMRLIDVTPTVLDLLGLAPIRDVDGRSVRAFVNGEQPFDQPASYFEALNANLTRDWARLTGIVRERLKLIDLPLPELYDLSADPGEQRNLYASHRERARELETRLDRIARSGSAPAPIAIDADAEARLRSLGYVVGSVAPRSRRYTAADDPKALVHLNAVLDDAAALWARGDAGVAMETLRGVIRERPDLTMTYDRLAFMLRATGRIDEAVRVLDQAARSGHSDRPLLRSLGAMLRDAGDLSRSASILTGLADADPADVESANALGITLARLGRRDESERLFRRVLERSPNAAETWNNLGSLYLASNRLADARAALVRAIEIDPALASAHNGLGVVYARTGETTRAAAEWRTALELRPDLADARANLERLEHDGIKK